MAAVELTFSGVLYDKLSRTTRPVVLIGEASLTGLGVGGGPILPGDPPQIWGPTDPRPGWGLPSEPPVIWGPNDPRPTPQIHIPRPPVDPPIDSDAVKPPPDGGGWGYFPTYGWGYFPKLTDAGPK